MQNNTTIELRVIDPATLIIDANIRSDAEQAITKTFQDSITEHGVKSPITVTERDGQLYVRDGQLRTIAAQRAELVQVPVIVVPENAETEDQRTADRIVDQWIHNEHRAAMSNSDRVNAIHQLHLAGLSATKIAKATKTSKKGVVDKALAAATSDTALAALDDGLTLDQAAILAQYENDEEATQALLTAAATGRFDYTAQRLADTAVDRALIAQARTAYEEAGIATSTNTNDLYGPNRPHRLRSLVKSDGSSIDSIEEIPVAHRLAFLRVSQDESTWVDAEGNPVDATLIDWDLIEETDADQKPEEGMIDPRTLTEVDAQPYVEPEWWVRDADGIDGVELRPEYSGLGRSTATAEPTEAEAEAAKQERRRVRELNKQADTANTVRRNKLSEILARKTLPKGSAPRVAAFIATTMYKHHTLFGVTRQQGSATTLTTDMLGANPITALEGATADRAQIVSLAIIAGAYEADLTKDAWRDRYYSRSESARARWLTFLAAEFDYPLSDVEKVITGDLTAEEVALD